MARKSPAAEEPTPQRLSEALEAMFGLIYFRFAGDSMTLMAESGLTMPQIVALKILAHAGPQPMAAVAERVGLTASTVSHLVDQLVKKGLVDRTEAPDDRRQKRIAITDAGATLLARLTNDRITEIARVLATLDPDTRRVLMGAVERATADLSRDLPLGKPGACKR